MRWAVLWIVLLGIVLLPFLLFEQQFNAFAEQVTAGTRSAWVAAAAVFGLLAFDVFLPVPSSIVSTASGVLFGFLLGSALIWSGMMVGCLVGYAVGVRGAGAARRFVGEDAIARASTLMQRYGDVMVVLCRPVPVLAEASVVFAGLVKASYGRFIALTAAANLGIATGYAAVGAYSRGRPYAFLVAFLGALLLPGAFIVLSRLTFGRTR